MYIDLAGILISIALSAWFAGAETVFLSFNKVYLPGWLRNNAKGAEAVNFLLDPPERFLVTTLTGNNLVNVLYSSLMAVFFTRQGFSEKSIFILAPLVLLIIGEVVPKTVGRQLADRLILPTGTLLSVARIILLPLSKPIEIILSKVQKALNLSQADLGQMLSRAEITSAIYDAGGKETLSFITQPMIRGIIRIGNQHASDLMTPRTLVQGLDVKTDISEALRIMLKSGYSRLLCFDGNMDSLVGVIFARDLLQASGKISEVTRPLPAVPASLSAFRLLAFFHNNNTNFAAVIDEYGGLAGVVSMEDLVEELIGPIEDEYDFKSSGIWKISNKAWLVSGNVKISQLSIRMGVEIPPVHASSVGGLIIELVNDIPETGFETEFANLLIKVIQADTRGVRLLRITRKDANTMTNAP